jgi:excisionase family DNA binding protein
MKPRPTQFGVRENTASSRQHASCLAADACSNSTCVDVGSSEAQRPSPQTESSRVIRSRTSHAAPRDATTAEEECDVTERLALTPPLRPSPKSRHAFEPLIGSPEAAKLLGNIHVKTLQRYARTRKLPGYRIGGHWYFRASELDAWLHSRINSNCQPADRVDFTQEKTK